MIYNIDNYSDNGAMIYFAIERKFVSATCMILPISNDKW